MRKLSYLLLLLGLVQLTACGSGDHNATIKKLSKHIFNAVKKNDYGSLKGYYLDEVLIKNAIKESDGKVDLEKGKEVELAIEFEEYFHKHFNSIQEKISKFGEVSTLKFKGNEDSESSDSKKFGGLEASRVKFRVSINDKEFHIRYDAFKIGGRWCIADRLKFSTVE